WKKLEPMWDLLIRAKRATSMLPVLEGVLSGFGQYRPGRRAVLWPRATRDDTREQRRVPELTTGREPAMDRLNRRTPLKLVLPIEVTTPAVQESPLPTPTGPVEVSPVHSSPDAPRPTFVPLALAIDLGQTGPIGS